MSHLFTLRRARLGFVALAGLVLAGCGNGAELNTFEPRGDTADEIFGLAKPVFIVAGLVLLAVPGGVLWLSIKNRVKTYEGDDEFPEQISHNNTLEIGWTIVPAIIMVIIAVLTISTHVVINKDNAAAITINVDGESRQWDPTIVVVGQQWWWEYRYYLDAGDIDVDSFDDPMDLPPADIVTAGQFAFPVGVEVDLVVTSRDVIHSHWIPRLNGKRDAVPGRFSPWKLDAREPGVYFGQCTEFCGLSHSRMRMQGVGMTEADFQAWIDEQMAPATWDGELADYAAEFNDNGSATIADPDNASPELRGMDLFAGRCASCHEINGFNDKSYAGAATVSGSAPDLTHLTSRTTFAGGILHMYNADGTLNVDDLSRWIRDPNGVKDNYANNLPDGQLPRGMPTLGLTESEIDDVVAFLSTLGPRPSDGIIAASEVE